MDPRLVDATQFILDAMMALSSERPPLNDEHSPGAD
jgi:hypothetical protein